MSTQKRDAVVALAQSLGVPIQHLAALGDIWFIGADGRDRRGYGGKYWTPMQTFEAAFDRMRPNDLLVVGPGAYDETVTIPRELSGICIVGAGPRGSAFLEPSTEDATGMVVLADDVAIANFGVAGEDNDAAHALRVYGARFSAHRCKFESAAVSLILSPGTVAQQAAGTHGDAADAFIDGCEFSWGVRGIDFVSSDYGAVTQPRISKCFFHNLTTCHIRSNDVAASNVCLRDALIEDCIFGAGEDAAAPTDFLLLNVTNDNGIVTRCVFASSTLAAATITLASGVWFLDNHAEAEGALATGGTAGRPD